MYKRQLQDILNANSTKLPEQALIEGQHGSCPAVKVEVDGKEIKNVTSWHIEGNTGSKHTYRDNFVNEWQAQWSTSGGQFFGFLYQEVLPSKESRTEIERYATTCGYETRDQLADYQDLYEQYLAYDKGQVAKTLDRVCICHNPYEKSEVYYGWWLKGYTEPLP